MNKFPISGKQFPIPPPPVFDSEFDININKSIPKLWCNDEEIKSKMSNKLSIMSINIGSLPKNFSELEISVDKYKPDIVQISEVWNPHLGAAHLKDYHTMIAKTRISSHGGGVGLFINKKYKFELIESVNNLQLSILEAIGAKVTFGKNIVKIISIYRPPRNDRLRTIQDFERLLDSIGTDGKIILAGDTNIHLDKQSILRLDYEKQLLDHRLNQYVNYYTRLTSESVSLIDHVISNINDLETLVTHEMCADHQTVIGIWGMKERQTKKLKVLKESRERIHIDKTIENLQKINWLDWNQRTANLDIDDTYDS